MRGIVFDRTQRLRRNALAALLLLVMLPSHGLGIEICPFHIVTGVICPACGLSRSISSLLHGAWWQSLQYHPLGILVTAWLVSLVVTNRNPVAYLPDYIKRHAKPLVSAGILLILGIWVGRLLFTP